MSANARDSVTEKAGGKLPLGSLKDSFGGLAKALGGKAMDKVTDGAGGITQRLTSFAEGSSNPKISAAGKGVETLAEGGSPAKAGVKAATSGLKDKVKGLFGGGGGKGGGKGKYKFNNIVES